MQLKNIKLSISIVISLIIVSSLIIPATGYKVNADDTSVSVTLTQGLTGYTGTLNQWITSNDNYSDPNNDHFYLRDYSGVNKNYLLLAAVKNVKDGLQTEGVPTPAPTSTPTDTTTPAPTMTPSPTPTDSPSPTPTMTPSPTPTGTPPLPCSGFKYSFGDMTDQQSGSPIYGIHSEPDVNPNYGVGFEDGAWTYFAYSNNLTNCACFTDNIKSAMINLPSDTTLKRITLSTGGNQETGLTYTYKISSPGNPDVAGTFHGLNVVFDVNTNWDYASPFVTIEFSGGWDSVMDNIVYDFALPPPITDTPTGTPTPTGTLTPTGTPTSSPTLTPTPTDTPSPSPTSTAVTFPDLQGYDWAKDSIESLAAAGIINGINGDDGILYYKPGNTVTRAEFCKLVVKTFSFTLTGTSKEFPDVEGVNHWAKSDIAIASSLGIVLGYDDDSFRPDNKVSRQELAVMITRAMNKEGIGTAVDDSETEQILGGFVDQADISLWAKHDVAFASKNGLIKGSPVQGGFAFNPLNQATRAETAVIIMRAYNAKNNT